MGRMTNLQLWSMLFPYVFATTIAFLIGPLAGHAGYSGWICIAAAAVVGIGLSSAALPFCLKRSNDYLGLYGHKYIGTLPHKILMLIFAFYFLHLAAYILREFVDFFSQVYLQETPPWAIAVFILFVAACLVQLGASGISRFAQGCFLLIGLMFLVKPLFFLEEYDGALVSALMRVGDIRTLWSETYNIVPWYGELFMLIFFVPELQKPQSARSILWFAALAGTYILLSEYILMIALFGPELSGALSYPALELAGFIRLGDFLQNLDPLIVSVWFMAYFIKLSLIFYAGVLTFSHACSIKEIRLFTMPLAAIVVGLSLILAKNSVELAYYFDRSWATFALLVECLPLVYPAAAWFRARKTKTNPIPSA
ncbi:GerAB/ArcD/ProY family transporter [Paenibacillus sp. GYB003]|uniref:GerAB/ArcD/ProY family transporter n=1 Tax=Paenibacillus sp. GYB003 TaxID=2994392 RepID=UPI002F9673A0